MKRLGLVSLLVGLLGARAVGAESIPSGCFVTDSWRAAYSGYFDPTINYAPPPCHLSNDGRYSWFDPRSATRLQLIGLYGEPMTAIIETVYVSDLQSLANFRAYKKQVVLVKKLKKACGNKCKKIK